MAKKTKAFLGIDLGGTKIHAVVVDRDGTVIASERAATEPKRGYRKVLATIAEVAREAAGQGGISLKDLPAIGIGVPGMVEAKKGRIVMAANLGWSDRPIAADLGEELGRPVVVGNDVNFGALGETAFGAARGLKSAFAAYVGTGLGGAIIVRGKVVNGAHGFAGEFGHMPSPFGLRPCGCGLRGCLETSASKTGMGHAIAEAVAKGERCLLPRDGTLKTSAIRKALDEGCPTTRAAIEQLAASLAWGLAAVGTVVDPQAFVLGGGVIEGLHERIVPMVAERMPRHSALYARHAPDLRVAALGDDGVAAGAAVAAMQAA
ncbi:MAG: Glucokinase [Planctomycetota bacterium]|jgi:glucokinase